MKVDGYSEELVNWDSSQWWTYQFNPYIGCKHISPACKNCYAKKMVERFKMNGEDGFKPTKHPKAIMPKLGIVFIGNLTDAFGDWVEADDVFNWFESMYHTNPEYKEMAYPPVSKFVPNIASYIWLTKRVGNMMRQLAFAIAEHPNAYYGFTAENQKWYDARIAELMLSNAKYGYNYMYEQPYQHWVSCEPLLGPINLHLDDAVNYCYTEHKVSDIIKQVVVGCESGPNRRVCNLEWIADIVDQCKKANTPVFVKQIVLPNGEFTKDISKFPKNLQIRQLVWAK